MRRWVGVARWAQWRASSAPAGPQQRRRRAVERARLGDRHGSRDGGVEALVLGRHRDDDRGVRELVAAPRRVAAANSRITMRRVCRRWAPRRRPATRTRAATGPVGAQQRRSPPRRRGRRAGRTGPSATIAQVPTVSPSMRATQEDGPGVEVGRVHPPARGPRREVARLDEAVVDHRQRVVDVRDAVGDASPRSPRWTAPPRRPRGTAIVTCGPARRTAGLCWKSPASWNG